MHKELNKKDLKSFLKLIIECAPLGNFNVYLNMSPRDIDLHKKRLNIRTIDDAKKMLRSLTPAPEPLVKKSEPKPVVESSKTKTALKVKKMTRAKNEKQMKKIKQNFEKTKKPIVSEWRLPETDSDSINQFYRRIIGLGLSFCANMYNVQTKDIKAEANRLKLKIDWDLVKR